MMSLKKLSRSHALKDVIKCCKVRTAVRLILIKIAGNTETRATTRALHEGLHKLRCTERVSE